jgi:hypothetical protein
MKDKQYIIGEIQRTATLNGGKPIGQTRFQTETGIAQHEWRGMYWARWGDALKEAGFEPLEWNGPSDEEEAVEKIAKLIRKFKRFPTTSEIQIEKRQDAQIPAPKVFFRRCGGRRGVIQKVRDYCTSREECADVLEILDKETIGTSPEDGVSESSKEAGKSTTSGYVYMVRSGKLYKIGCSENHWRRKSELHKQTSEGITEIHTIAAVDDAPGIEKYWHERFKEKRQHGEWFDLSADDISAFKKRKFM